MRLLFKSHRFLAAGLSCLAAFGAQAQASSATDHDLTPAVTAAAPPRKGGNVIKIAPLGWIHGSMPFTTETRVGYERRIAPHSSLGVSYSHLGTNYPFSFLGSFALSAAISAAIATTGHVGFAWTDASVRASGTRWQAYYRQYLSKRRLAPEGWYLSPQVSYAEVVYAVKLSDFGHIADIDVTNRNVNLLFGHQRVLGKHFVFDVFTGLGYRKQTRSFHGIGSDRFNDLPHGTHLKLSSGMNLGWAF